jgi:hypothetical protein
LNNGAASPIFGCGNSPAKQFKGTVTRSRRSRRTACLREEILSIFIILTGNRLKVKE